MEQIAFNPTEIGRSISEFGFMVICSASYLLSTGFILFFFIRWFIRIINIIINRQQHTLDEILRLELEQTELLKRSDEHKCCDMNCFWYEYAKRTGCNL